MSFQQMCDALSETTGRTIATREEALAAFTDWTGLDGAEAETEFEIACGEGSDTPVLAGGREEPDPLDADLARLEPPVAVR